MIIPIGDDNSDRRRVPIVTYTFVALNLLVFAVFQQFGSNAEFTYSYAAVPEEIITGTDVITESRTYQDPVSGSQYTVPGLGPTPFVYLTLITSMFMHGGLAHLLGNLLFLWIFGDNVEDWLGRFRFFLFYLVTGVAAALAHVFVTVWTGMPTTTPMVGASGAISAVLGAYVVLFPRRRVRVILLRILMRVPAVVAILVWFAFQVASGTGLLGAGSQSGGVAYAAHVGGFLAGVLLIRLFGWGKSRLRR
jgi:membrane associated rhomboid family serine protease